jgi:hypothetical protein
MKKVAIYIRSSKDRHDVSCKAQEEQIRGVVKEKGEKVSKTKLSHRLGMSDPNSIE